MNGFDIKDIQHKKFSINVENYEKTLKVNFIGIIDITFPGEILNPLINQIHITVRKNNLTNIFCDFTTLKYINSSTLKILIDWLMWINNLDKNLQYQIIFLLNHNYLWQESSVKAALMLFDQIVDFA